MKSKSSRREKNLSKPEYNNALAVFLREHPHEQIVSDEHLDSLYSDVLRGLRKSMSAMQKKISDPKNRLKDAQYRRLQKLNIAIEDLSKEDVKLLGIGLWSDELEVKLMSGPVSYEMNENDDFVGYSADVEIMLAKLRLAIVRSKLTREMLRGNRTASDCLMQFVGESALLYVAYGFVTIDGNYSQTDPTQRAVFQKFLHAILEDFGIPDPGASENEHEPFRIFAYPVRFLGETAADRQEWVNSNRELMLRWK